MWPQEWEKMDYEWMKKKKKTGGQSHSYPLKNRDGEESSKSDLKEWEKMDCEGMKKKKKNIPTPIPWRTEAEKNYGKSDLKNGRRWTANEWKKRRWRRTSPFLSEVEKNHRKSNLRNGACEWMRKKKKEDMTNPTPQQTMTTPYHNTMKDVTFEPPFENSRTFKATVGNPSELGLLGKYIHDSCDCLLTPGRFREVVHLYIIDLEMQKK